MAYVSDYYNKLPLKIELISKNNYYELIILNEQLEPFLIINLFDILSESNELQNLQLFISFHYKLNFDDNQSNIEDIDISIGSLDLSGPLFFKDILFLISRSDRHELEKYIAENIENKSISI
jgi:hypothetical protein